MPVAGSIESRTNSAVHPLCRMWKCGIWNDRSVNPTNTLKVSVLATGELLLDGQPVTLPALEQALGQAPKDDTVVWYYRENAVGDPPSVVAEVMKLITANRLPVRLSSRPDFSDTVTPNLP